MARFLNEHGLPKEWAKKKKIPLFVCQYFSNETPSDEFNINADCERVYLTIDAAVTARITDLLNAGVSIDDMKTGIFAIVELNYSTMDLNAIPLYQEPNGNGLDAEFDLETLSFNFTSRGKIYADMSLSMSKVTDVTVDHANDKWNISNINMRAVINNV